jgi:hypothetical protein
MSFKKSDVLAKFMKSVQQGFYEDNCSEAIKTDRLQLDAKPFIFVII